MWLKCLAEFRLHGIGAIPLAACVGEVLCWLSRERKCTWYIGGLNAWGFEGTIQVDCSFLPQDKKYTIKFFRIKKVTKNANLYEHKIMDMDNKNIIRNVYGFWWGDL